MGIHDLADPGAAAPGQPARTTVSRRHWACAALAGGLCLLFGAPSLMHPFGFDQANQAYIATRVLEGDVLYRDVACLKPPLAIYLHVAAIALFGKNMVAVRILDLLWVLLTAATLALFVRRSFGDTWPSAPYLTAALYCHYCFTFNFWHTAQTDGWLNLPIAAGMLLAFSLLDDRERTWSRTLQAWGLVGVLGWAALLFKYNALPLVLLWFLAVPFLRPGRRRAGFLGLASGLALGAAATALLLAMTGSLQAYVKEHLLFVAEYGGKTGAFATASAQETPFARLFGRLGNLAAAYEIFGKAPVTFGFALLGAAGALVAAYSSRGCRTARLTALAIGGWICAAWASTAVQGRFFGYHFLPNFAPWAILAGLGIGVPVDALSRRFGRIPVFVGGICLLLVLSLLARDASVHRDFRPTVRAQLGSLGALLAGRITLEQHWSNRELHDINPNFPVSETLAVARHIRDTTTPQQSLFMWGTDMAVAFLADRPRVSTIDTSLQASGTGAIPGGGDPTTRLLDDFRRSPPAVIVVQQGDAIPHILGHNKDSYRLLLENERISQYIREKYSQSTRVGRFAILLRNE